MVQVVHLSIIKGPFQYPVAVFTWTLHYGAASVMIFTCIRKNWGLLPNYRKFMKCSFDAGNILSVWFGCVAVGVKLGFQHTCDFIIQCKLNWGERLIANIHRQWGWGRLMGYWNVWEYILMYFISSSQFKDLNY